MFHNALTTSFLRTSGALGRARPTISSRQYWNKLDRKYGDGSVKEKIMKSSYAMVVRKAMPPGASSNPRLYSEDPRYQDFCVLKTRMIYWWGHRIWLIWE